MLKSFGYLQKLNVIYAYGEIPKNLYDNLRNLNTFRNKYAHHADRITFEQKRKLCFHKSDENGPEGFVIGEWFECMPTKEELSNVAGLACLHSVGWLNNLIIATR